MLAIAAETVFLNFFYYKFSLNTYEIVNFLINDYASVPFKLKLLKEITLD